MKAINKIISIANHIQKIDEEICELSESDFIGINEFLKSKKVKINLLPFKFKVESLIRESKGFAELQNELYSNNEMEAHKLSELYDAFTVICNNGLDTLIVNGRKYKVGNKTFQMNDFKTLEIK